MDDIFMEICDVIAKRSACLKNKVGAVIVRNGRVISIGYNGMLPGFKHCEKPEDCPRWNLKSGTMYEVGDCQHAEQNAIIQAASFGISTKDSVLYCTTKPCITCAKILANAGVRKIYVAEQYPDEFSDRLLAELKIPVIFMEKPDMSFICNEEDE